MAADLKLLRTPAEETILARFPALAPALPGGGALAGRRAQALDLIAQRGLPHRRVEEWKYTDLRALMREAAPPAGAPSLTEIAAAYNFARAFAAVEAVRLTIVNGHYIAESAGTAPLPAGVEVTALRDALATGHPLLAALDPVEAARDNAAYALNTAFLDDGVAIRIGAGCALDIPVHLRFVHTGTEAFSTATRVVLLVEGGASLTLIESHEGPDGVGYQPNDVVAVVAADAAKVAHVRLNAHGADALALSTMAVKLGAGVAFDSLSVATGGAVSRHQLFVNVAGEGVKLSLNGATMLRARQHADTTLLVDHAVPHGISRELYKTIVDDEATGVFQGKIIVRPRAQKTDGRMMSAALLLSEGAAMNNKPELEIFADDVQCAHGATCGELDENLLFYLMARGLPRHEAENLMVQAFLGEAVETVAHEAVRGELTAIIERWLARRR